MINHPSEAPLVLDVFQRHDMYTEFVDMLRDTAATCDIGCVLDNLHWPEFLRDLDLSRVLINIESKTNEYHDLLDKYKEELPRGSKVWPTHSPKMYLYARWSMMRLSIE